MRRGTLRTVAATATLCVLAGCTGDPADPPTTPPATTATPSPSATPRPTPTPDAATPPQRPDMSHVDAQTAEAVATYFLQLYPYVYASGDLTEWRALSHPDCIFCASVTTNVEEMVAAGEHWVGGGTTITSCDALAEVTDAFNITATTAEEPSSRVSRGGVTLENTVGGESTLHLVVTARESQWLVRAVEVD